MARTPQYQKLLNELKSGELSEIKRKIRKGIESLRNRLIPIVSSSGGGLSPGQQSGSD